LEEVGRTRQLVVLTHDDRLPEACWRLGIDARVLEVTRQPGSVVTVTEALDRWNGISATPGRWPKTRPCLPSWPPA
jgi:hypothetical protein